MGTIKIVNKGIDGRDAYNSFLNENKPCIFAKINERKKIHNTLKETLQQLVLQFDIDIYVVSGDFDKMELPIMSFRKDDKIYPFVNRKERRNLQELPSFKRKIKAQEIFDEFFTKEAIENKINSLI